MLHVWALLAWAAAPTPQATREAVVLPSVVDMYSRPDENVDVVSQAILGQVVGVLDTTGAFARIETPDGYHGFVPLRALRVYAAGAARYASSGRLAEVESLMANVYRDADVTSARPKTQAPLGVRLEVLREQSAPGWHAVRLPAGDTGNVQAGDVRLVDASAPARLASPQELVATARRFVGLPYLWGGMTALGLDCSGLVSQVYRAGGRMLPRDASLQFDDPRLTPVERDALRPADLVFFGRRKITHVGLYAGEGRFVHATTHDSPRVQESRLDEPYWSALYRGARRVR